MTNDSHNCDVLVVGTSVFGRAALAKDSQFDKGSKADNRYQGDVLNKPNLRALYRSRQARST